MNRKLAGIALAVTAATLTAAPPSMAEQQSKGRALAELSFESVDRHGKGYLDQGDMEAARKDIFVSMDSDESGNLEPAEFLQWGYGFENIAQDQNKLLAYRTALKVVYRFWDRNGDGKITPTEHRQAVIRDFDRADLNNNAVLEKDEFVSGFSVLVAIRAALKPE